MKPAGVNRALLLTSLLALSSCTMQRLEGQGPLALNQKWETRFNGGDANGVAALYWSDARLFLPGSEPLIGTVAIRTAIDSLIKTGAKVRVRPAEHSAAGDIAYVVGSYTILNGEREVERGSFVEIWKRAGGSWKILHDMNAPGASTQPSL
jgi:uncharacterized protein (TIGR02246 family)